MAAAAALMVPAAVAIIIMLLIPTGYGGAFTSFKQLNTHTPGGSYMVGDEDIESEFGMESNMSRIMSRIMAETQNFETSSTSNATQTSPGPCDRPPRYDSCLGEKRTTPPPQNCSTFNREHPC